MSIALQPHVELVVEQYLSTLFNWIQYSIWTTKICSYTQPLRYMVLKPTSHPKATPINVSQSSTFYNLDQISCVDFIATSLGTWSQTILVNFVELDTIFNLDDQNMLLHASFKVQGTKTNTLFKNNTYQHLPITNILQPWSNLTCRFHCNLVWNLESNNIGQLCSIAYKIQFGRLEYAPTHNL